MTEVPVQAIDLIFDNKNLHYSIHFTRDSAPILVEHVPPSMHNKRIDWYLIPLMEGFETTATVFVTDLKDKKYLFSLYFTVCPNRDPKIQKFLPPDKETVNTK